VAKKVPVGILAMGLFTLFLVVPGSFLISEKKTDD
jgi:hypothetical protein